MLHSTPRFGALLLSALALAGCSSQISSSQPTQLAGPQARAETRYRTPSSAGSCMNEIPARLPYPPSIIVRRGDTLCKLARRYETTVQAIVDANRLSSPDLTPGMRLDLPSNRWYATSPFGQLRRR